MNIRLLLLLLVCQPLLADDAAQSIPAVDPVSSTYLVKITMGLAFIIVLIFVLAWVMKKMQLAPQSGSPMIKILSAISVGSRDRIALLEVGEEQILVGLTPGRIQKLHTLSTPVTVDHGRADSRHGFSDRFSTLLNQGRQRPDARHGEES